MWHKILWTWFPRMLNSPYTIYAILLRSREKLKSAYLLAPSFSLIPLMRVGWMCSERVRLPSCLLLFFQAVMSDGYWIKPPWEFTLSQKGPTESNYKYHLLNAPATLWFIYIYWITTLFSPSFASECCSHHYQLLFNASNLKLSLQVNTNRL